MKREFLILAPALILISFFPGCLREHDSLIIDIEKPIKTELSVMFSGPILKEGTNVVIHNQTTLDSVFTAELINRVTELQKIDFTKNDVLAGAETFTRGISGLEHHLIQSANSIYIYKLYVHFDLTLQGGVFYYGIIIEKLPAGSHVIFDIDLLK